MREDGNDSRYHFLDSIRGLTLISMILYHLVWDLMYLFGKNHIFPVEAVYYWQQSICRTFILLSGFCWSLGKRKVRRGILVLLGGTLIFTVTSIIYPQQPILFGILHMLGLSMLLLIPLDKMIKRIPTSIGFFGCLGLFILLKDIQYGFIGIEDWKWISVPKEWYRDSFTACLGFPGPDFYSVDYFPILPWFFLFVAGYYLYRYIENKEAILEKLKWGIPGLNFLGENSLLIYLIHQPIIYGILQLWFAR